VETRKINSMNLEVKGTIEKMEETQTFDSGFTKRVVVIKTAGEYPQSVAVEFVKDNIAKLDSIKTGDHVTVDTNVRSNEFNGKYYLNLTGWKISKSGEEFKGVTTPAMQEAMDKLENVAEEDDLPF